MGGRRVKDKIMLLLVLIAILFLLFSIVIMMLHQILLADQQILDFIEGIRLADNPQSSRTIH